MLVLDVYSQITSVPLYKYPCSALFTQRTTNYDKKGPATIKLNTGLYVDRTDI